jgi:acetyl esterase
MPVDPNVQQLLDLMAGAGGEPLSDGTLAATRDSFGMLVAMTAGTGPESVTLTVRNIDGPHGDIELRVYAPQGDAGGARGGVLFVHGGGWTIGSAAAYDPIAKILAAGADAVVVSVDYRLAPEHPFPVPLDECAAALDWIVAHAAELGIDPTRIAVAGDSAGGNLSAVLAQQVRDVGGPALAAQILIYPVTDHDFDRPSYRDNGAGYFLDRSMMEYFWSSYTRGGADPTDPRLSPLRAPSLEGLPPALVITAEFDPLRDEGEAYAAALEAAGVAVEQTRYDGMIHGFAMMPVAIPAGAQALDQATRAIRRAFGTLDL